MSYVGKLWDRHLARHRYYKERRTIGDSLVALSEERGLGRVRLLQDLAKHEQVMSGLHPQGWPHRASRREDEDGRRPAEVHSMRARLYLLLAFTEAGTFNPAVVAGEYEHSIEPILTKLTELSAGSADEYSSVVRKAALLNGLWLAARPWIGEAAAEAVFAFHRALLRSVVAEEAPTPGSDTDLGSAGPVLKKTPAT